MSRRLLEIESLAAFDTHIRRAPRLDGWFVSSLDLTERSAALLAVDPSGAVFLGCHFDGEVEDRLRAAGALLFPRLPDLPFDPYRPGLYDATELYGTGPVRHSADAVTYAWARSAAATQLSGALATTCTTTRSVTRWTTRPPPWTPATSSGSWAATRCGAPTRPTPPPPGWVRPCRRPDAPC